MSNHGGLHPAQPFPKAAREQVLKAQLRANLRKVTYTIRDKRANVVAELPHWEGLRDLGAATKNATMTIPRAEEIGMVIASDSES